MIRGMMLGQPSEASWTPPDDCGLWLSGTLSGALGTGETWPNQIEGGISVVLQQNAVVSVANGMEIPAGDYGTKSGCTPVSEFNSAKDAECTLAFWAQLKKTDNYCIGFSGVASSVDLSWPASRVHKARITEANRLVGAAADSGGANVWAHWVLRRTIVDVSGTLRSYWSWRLNNAYSAGPTLAPYGTSYLWRISHIGAVYTGSAYTFIGYMDEIMFWPDRALTDDECNGLYTNPYTKA